MGIQTATVEPHWNYLLAIERDVEIIARFVELDQRNFECFSIEIARVLLATAAEVDVVCKQICMELNPDVKAESITDYRREIVTAFPGLPTFEVHLTRFGLKLTPWIEWESPAGVPPWWTAYNKTKHQRHSKYHLANLRNALDAVAGLFVVVLYLYREKARAGRLLPPAQLLRVGVQHFAGSTHHDYEIGTNYKL